MMKTLILLIPLLSMAALRAAEEWTVEATPFRIEHEFEARAIPEDAAVLRLEPESWEAFVIESLHQHGREVEAGEVVIEFEREDYQRRLQDLERAVAGKQLARDRAEAALALLEREQALAAEAARRSHAEASEDLAHFEEEGRELAEARLAQRIDQARFRLEAEREELAQLKQMYDADEVTEATEEIILERQQRRAAWAEEDLRQAREQVEREREAGLPRRHRGLQHAVARAELALAGLESRQPAALEEARLALATASTELSREQEELERLRADGELLRWQAPRDGLLLHGALEDGEWKLGDLAKQLTVGGTPPRQRGLLSVVPARVAAPLFADVAPEVARSLAPDSAIAITVPGREDLPLRARLESLAPVAGADRKHRLELAVEWPEDFRPQPAATVRCRALVYANDAAIALPRKALQIGSDGAASVEMKLADGRSERRPVRPGRVAGERVEILDGLEPGQVLLLPE